VTKPRVAAPRAGSSSDAWRRPGCWHGAGPRAPPVDRALDTLTHALSGALAARATARPNGALRLRTRVALGFAAAAFPDGDIVVRLAGDTLTYLDTHRGVTHSVVMLPAWVAGAVLVAWLAGARGRVLREIAFVFGLGIAVHILGDVITAYGTMIFAPLSRARVSFPVTFIIDPWFTAIILAGLLVSWRRPAARAPARAAIACLCLYVGGQAVLHGEALAVARSYAQATGRDGARVHALPQPFSPFNWKLLVQDDRAIEESYLSLWRARPVPSPGSGADMFAQINAAYRPAHDLHWVRHALGGPVAQSADLVHEAWEAPALAVFRRFALYAVPDRVVREPRRTCVWFVDLRFTLAGRNAPFRYGACRAGELATWTLVGGQ